MNKTDNKKTTSIDRDGKSYILGTPNFNGTLLELRNLIDNCIEEYGETTECMFDIYSNKTYPGGQIIIK